MQSSSIESLNAQISSEDSDISSKNSAISSKNSAISSESTQIANLNNSVMVLSGNVSSLNGQLAKLRKINALNFSILEESSQSYITGGRSNVTIAAFDINFSGYVVVTMSSASDYLNEGISLGNIYSSNINSPDYGEIIMPYANGFYYFTSIPNSLVFPVVSGSVQVYLATSDPGSQSATLSVTYYY